MGVPRAEGHFFSAKMSEVDAATRSDFGADAEAHSWLSHGIARSHYRPRLVRGVRPAAAAFAPRDIVPGLGR
jgi:hypothetical protein